MDNADDDDSGFAAEGDHIVEYKVKAIVFLFHIETAMPNCRQADKFFECQEETLFYSRSRFRTGLEVEVFINLFDVLLRRPSEVILSHDRVRTSPWPGVRALLQE